MKPKLILVLILIFSMFLSVYFYKDMPERVVAHWNIKGEPDGDMPKFSALFLTPSLLLILLLLYMIIPKIDPLKHNISSFRKYYNWFFVVLFLFFLVVQLQIILWNKGVIINTNIIYPLLCGLLFLYVSVLCKNAKRNWFIGIRTPWTLSNDVVWKKTHEMGARLFLVCGIIAILGVMFYRYAFWFLILPLIVSLIYLFIYSYLLYKKEVS